MGEIEEVHEKKIIVTFCGALKQHRYYFIKVIITEKYFQKTAQKLRPWALALAILSGKKILKKAT